jgi:hypothetical protein
MTINVGAAERLDACLCAFFPPSSPVLMIGGSFAGREALPQARAGPGPQGARGQQEAVEAVACEE